MGTSRHSVVGFLLLLLVVSAACSTNSGGGPANSCTQKAGVAGCTSTGYSCNGSDTPDKGTSSLACTGGVPGSGGATLYCCLTGDTFSASTCAPDRGVSGCAGDSYGFSCAGSNTPSQIDGSLTCTTSSGAHVSSTPFCCTTNVSEAGPPAGCTPDSTAGCSTSHAVGYSCSGGSVPAQSSLVCAAGSPGINDTMVYCCFDFSSTPCTPDPSLQGCVAPSFGFRCTGSSPPSSIDPAVTCSMGTAGNNGQTLYCCMD